MAFFLIGSDVHDIIRSRRHGQKELQEYNPLVTVIVPAHNEEKTLLRNIKSVAASTYKYIELIIVNDSSTDATKRIACKFQREYFGVKVVDVQVRGKAKALNLGLKYANGTLVMCLDADSMLSPNAIENAVKEFRDENLVALSANVKILADKGFLNLLQRVEYLLNYQMKKAEVFAHIQYIIGGVGSMYRLTELKEVGLYDTDTITEDIDLSMKIIEFYGKDKKIGYSPNVVVYTEAVLSLPDLYKQRIRWKYGRYQSFFKRRKLFFSTRYNFLLSWIYLPYALYAEFSYLLEPLILGYVLYLIIQVNDYGTLITCIIVFVTFTTFQMLGASNGYNLVERLKLSFLSILLMVPMYLVVYYEYLVSVVGLISIKKIMSERKKGTFNCEWNPVERSGSTTFIGG
ncbi:MAG TPA: glycosyltransferase family 2 protein [Candidatus Dojkabacteria bacterium]|nr:glycosyltransferase family 2 protein [Candidatus Dojkabacteria bacterium]HRP51554.1 glycosyltransferase family 2 protein [Candidatus Dojkabacteria bacterium]